MEEGELITGKKSSGQQDLSTSGMEEGADLRVTFNPAKSRTSNIYTCIKFEDP